MKTIPLTQGKVAWVDDENYEWLSKYKWSALKGKYTYYAKRSVWFPLEKKNSSILMHRMILGLKLKNQQCDHIDGDGLNNQKSNLRTCNNKQNQHNKKSGKNSHSKYKGVNWSKQTGKWVAKIHVAGKSVNLGYFDSEQCAAKIYDRVALFEFGNFARTNFPRKNYNKKELLSVQQIVKNRLEKRSSSFNGVCWDKRKKKWMAQIYVKRKQKQKFLGYFNKEEDAAKAVEHAESQQI